MVVERVFLRLETTKLGAGRAYGVDIDAMAVEAAKANAVINGVQDKFKAVLGDGTELDAEEPASVDVLVANILITPNIELASKFVKNDSKRRENRIVWDFSRKASHRRD